MSMRVTWAIAALAVASVGGSGLGYAQGDTGTPGQAAAKCSEAGYRAFDFWLGEWEVRRPDGTVVGENRITSILAGCALREEWTGASGSVGTSYNMWDAATRRWHQTWVDNQGLLLLLDGGFTDGKMVLRGERPGQDGKSVLHRISWEPREDGTVRQLWETSNNAGSTWQVAFDGTYRRRH